MAAKLTAADYARIYTKRFNWSLVPIEPGRKFPQSSDWGNNCLTEPEEAAKFYEQNPDWNMGLALTPSRMVSLDIDCEQSWNMILEEFGLPINCLDEYPTIKGKGKRVMFALPDGLELPYCKLNWPNKNDGSGEKHKAIIKAAQQAKESGDEKREARLRRIAKRYSRYTVIELRAGADKQRQDVLPPSIHPETKQPYTWIVQPPKNKPWPTPPDWLLAVWQAWGDFKPQFVDTCPWLPKRPAPASKPSHRYQPNDGVDVIGAYCQANPLPETLERYGYKKVGKRYLSPYSGTGLPGVVPFEEGRCYIFHASDPLGGEESGKPVNSFDLFCCYDHGNDPSKAVKAAAKELGIEFKRPDPVPPPLPPKDTEAADPTPPEQSPEFRVLGYNGSKLYVLPRRSEQVVAMSMGALTKPGLLQIASLEWWELAFAKPKGGADWDAAMNALIRRAENAGIYNSKLERGRGAWYDNGKPVLHLGTSLIVDGAEKAISDHASRYIYTKQVRMENTFNAKPASDEDGRVLVSIFDRMNWLRPEHGVLALGWSILAPVCGALEWRPHLWLTAQRGAGKSWTQGMVIKPLVGEGNLVYCQGGTTEAGIRQTLKHDARPVMFDEAEGEDASAARRMQHVIELARQASSEYGAEIAKGTANGEGMTFNIRSMFLMGSINVGLRQAADESRFTVVALRTPDRTAAEAQRFAEFEKEVKRTLTDEFCASIRARTYSLIPVIRKNAEVLSQSVAEVMGSQRMGDQIGALLAGALSAFTSDALSLEDARQYVASLDLSDANDAEQVSDEHNCLNAILQTQVRVDYAMGGGTHRSVGELIEIANSDSTVDGIASDEAAATLARHGVRAEGEQVWVANSHKELERALANTPWATGHRRLLLRIEGAEASKNPAKFAGSLSRYVSIPISATC